MGNTSRPKEPSLGTLPSISEVDRFLSERGLPHGKPVREQVRQVLDAFRKKMRSNGQNSSADREAILEAIALSVQHPPQNQLRPVINATDVVIHTNLGRAVLTSSLLNRAAPLLTAYTNLEFDLDSGKRGGRGGRVPELLSQLSGAEDALVVNNNASAVLLMLSALAAGGEVIVSRGELVEIGGAFRVPDIMRQSGVTLVEVGTTNRTRLSDYAEAITPQTIALLKVHRSNFSMAGFVEETPIQKMAALGEEKGLGVWHDLGSGNFYRFQQPALSALLTVEQELKAGADVLTLSGDKLMGSVQAGIVVGKAEAVSAMRKHPLYRSLRMDKVRLALLEQSLLDYLSIDTLRENNPVVECLERTVEDMEPLAASLMKAIGSPRRKGLEWELTESESLAGGGALPEVRMKTLCLAIKEKGGNGEALASSLRKNQPPIIARIQEGTVLLDFRTLFQDDMPHLVSALTALG